jgi:hypothetical protein
MNSRVTSIHARTAFVWLTLSTIVACSDASGTTDTVFPHGGSTADGERNNPGQGGASAIGNGGAQLGGTNSGVPNGGSNTGTGGSSNGTANNGGTQSSGGQGSGGASGGFSFGDGGTQSPGGTSFGRGGVSSGNGDGGNGNGGRAAGGTNAGGRNNSFGGASGGKSASGGSGGKSTGGASSGGTSSAGMNAGGNSAGAGGDPFAVAAKCTSGTNWTSGNNANMRPGEACVGCHRFTLAGTVYPTGHEPNDCNGVGTSAAATVVITDAKGTTLRLNVNSAGNFYSSTAISAPYTAVVQTSKGSRAMVASQTNGNCNSCHTQNGANGAPGRIVVP